MRIYLRLGCALMWHIDLGETGQPWTPSIFPWIKLQERTIGLAHVSLLEYLKQQPQYSSTLLPFFGLTTKCSISNDTNAHWIRLSVNSVHFLTFLLKHTQQVKTFGKDANESLAQHPRMNIRFAALMDM